MSNLIALILAIVVLTACRAAQASTVPHLSQTATLTREYPRATEQAFSVLTFKDAQAKVNFIVPVPKYLPLGLTLKGAHVSPPDWIHYFYQSANGSSGLEVEISKGNMEFSYVYPNDAKVPMLIHENSATCVQGAWDGLRLREWRADIDAAAIQWTSKGFNFRVAQNGLQLDCNALLHVAKSLSTPSAVR